MRENKIVGIYLAAGQSTRMGSDKLGLPIGPMNLGNYALTAALNSRLDYVCIIAKDIAPSWIDSSIFHQNSFKSKWSITCCPEAQLGQAYSLRCGIQAAIAMEAKAAMILLADQPFITTEMINELLIRFQTHSVDDSISFIASSYDGLARPPVIFDQMMFPDLLQLQNDQGARHLIRKGQSGLCVDFPNPDLFMDVDTADDYRVLLEKLALWKS
ncbi:nucleotidyltransferase family protein [Paenibacillus albiflavus]|uniref:Nucleotidyltransferase family protein n=1 Tax=Paenibacillus albiflavus TaxID=2545760 RepID=A0A4R4ELG8_9BACL|nr:NTP transferase domain-containing protein [Paenibacillus albiflavus]TCZ81104.1 nucleotidyltransferase family protein [Paenibacillus albiflavus]